MSNSRSSDIFLLIRSMTKAEKRAFKLYAKRGSGTQHMFLKLFDLYDSMSEIDDELIIKKMKIDVGQYSNLKRHLYTQILNSLRMLNVEKQPNIKIREHIDKAYVLYGKGLYMQALNLLNIAKQLCNKYGTDFSLLTILEFEKNIHSRHITRLKVNEFDNLLSDSSYISDSIANRVKLTNLKIKLHRLYIQDGHVKDKKSYSSISKYFQKHIKQIDYDQLRIMEKIYYCQCYVWYYYLIDDYTGCMKYAMQWINLFKSSKALPKRDYNLYLRGYHYVMTSAFNLKDEKTHEKYLIELDQFRETNYIKFNKNNKIFSFLYVHTGRLNNAFLKRDYKEGVQIIPSTLTRLKRYILNLDQHKVMVLHYKIAWMYICGDQAKKAIPYLEGIINLKKKSLREDIQSYTRLMHLIALYDLEDYTEILNLTRKYKYYFEQVRETNELQKASLRYFQKITTSPIFDRKKIHQDFHRELIKMKENKFERRAFLYLDIIYWVEEKIK